MRILVLSHEIPGSANRPGSARLYSFCEELAKSHELFFGTLCEDKEMLAWLSENPNYARIFRDIEIFPDPPKKSGWLGRQKHRFSLSSYYDTRHLHPEYYREMCKRVDRLIREKRVDLVYVNCMPISQYVSSSLDIPVVVDLHDCISGLFRRAIGMYRNPIRKLGMFLEFVSIARCERRLARLASLLILISTADEESLKSLAPNARTLVIPIGVDLEYFKSQGTSPEKTRIVFTGVISYPPNEDAIVYFIEDIFPLVKRKVPEAEFWVVGKDPSDRVRSLASHEGIHVTGTVEDVRPYLESARVFVSPLRVGAGMKNKILNAMAMKRPVVATSLSLNGIDALPNRDILVADTPGEFADQVERLIRDDGLALRLGQSGWDLVSEHYSWEAAHKLLRPVFARLEGLRSTASVGLRSHA